MKRLTILLTFLACNSSDLSGKWKTGFGTLEVTQKGDSLLGRFVNGGEFTGHMKGDTIHFKITNASFTSKNLVGYIVIKDKNNMKGKVKEEGSSVYDGTFYMMKVR